MRRTLTPRLVPFHIISGGVFPLRKGRENRSPCSAQSTSSLHLRRRHAIVATAPPLQDRFKKGRKERKRLTPQGNHLLVKVHDGALCGDGPSYDVVGVLHVDDDDLLCPIDLLPHTDEPIRLEGEGSETDRPRLDSERGELLQEAESVSGRSTSSPGGEEGKEVMGLRARVR
jgi:hypothetical protein